MVVFVALLSYSVDVVFCRLTWLRVCLSCMLVIVVVFFFFQAEDGIRDLVRSRGLGDVYKRQRVPGEVERRMERHHAHDRPGDFPAGVRGRSGSGAVSYTHLTLPTSDLV